MKRIYCHFWRTESREAIVSNAILFHMRLFRTENLVAIEAWRNGFSTLLRRHQCQIQKQCATHQQHGGNLFRLGQYKKSVNSMIVIFCLLLACYLPYFIVAIVTMVLGKSSSTMLAWNMTSAFVYLNSLLNPLVYCWRMREIRRAVDIALKCFTRWIFPWQIKTGDFSRNSELSNIKQRICQGRVYRSFTLLTLQDSSVNSPEDNIEP